MGGCVPRALTLAPKCAEDDDAAEEHYEDLHDQVAAVLAQHGIEAVSSRVYWVTHGSVLGGWNGWPRACAVGFSEPGVARFDLFVLLAAGIGKATEEIITLAAQAGKPVYLYHRGGFVPVQAVMMLDPETWGAGRATVLIGAEHV